MEGDRTPEAETKPCALRTSPHLPHRWLGEPKFQPWRTYFEFLNAVPSMWKQGILIFLEERMSGGSRQAQARCRTQEHRQVKGVCSKLFFKYWPIWVYCRNTRVTTFAVL